MSDKNYFKTIYENRKTYRSKEVSDELAEREVLTLFNLLSHFYKKTYSDQNNTVIDMVNNLGYLIKQYIEFKDDVKDFHEYQQEILAARKKITEGLNDKKIK